MSAEAAIGSTAAVSTTTAVGATSIVATTRATVATSGAAATVMTEGNAAGDEASSVLATRLAATTAISGTAAAATTGAISTGAAAVTNTGTAAAATTGAVSGSAAATAADAGANRVASAHRDVQAHGMAKGVFNGGCQAGLAKVGEAMLKSPCSEAEREEAEHAISLAAETQSYQAVCSVSCIEKVLRTVRAHLFDSCDLSSSSSTLAHILKAC
jgi:hypothetical protein